MSQEHLPLSTFANLDKDFKAEVIAAEMVARGISAERILIQQTGGSKRSLRKDVEGISEETSGFDHKEYSVIKTPREGIYDMLPEGVFHRAAVHRGAATETEIIKSMKQRQAEEVAARNFFLPMEATINYLRMQLAMYENRLDKRTVHDELANIFRDEWEIFQHLDARQGDFFLHLVPILHDIRDNHSIIETILELMFGLPVKICLRSQLPLHPEAPMLTMLGDSALGVDFTTGNEVFEEGVDEILVTIGPVTTEVFQQFMPGKKNSRILELLYDYLLPVHMDIITEVVLPQTSRETRLADGINSYNTVLGTDTYL
jgi:hypothetical protein